MQAQMMIVLFGPYVSFFVCFSCFLGSNLLVTIDRGNNPDPLISVPTLSSPSKWDVRSVV
jgi:Ni/Fe-hydrogenase subunit HybB-like protein